MTPINKVTWLVIFICLINLSLCRYYLCEIFRDTANLEAF